MAIKFCRLAKLGEAFRYVSNRVPAGRVLMFHSHISDAGKRRVSDEFCTGERRTLCCVFSTSAFSMGKQNFQTIII